MKLQISYDIANLPEALAIAKQTESFADIIEVSTVLLYKEGVKAIESFKKTFKGKNLLVDAKICDSPAKSIAMFAQAGASIITVLAGAPNKTIFEATKKAHELNTKVALDLLDAYSVGQSAMDAEKLGIDIMLFSRTHEEKQIETMLERWEKIRGNTNIPIFISGKITRSNIERIIKLKPQGIVIGAAITQSKNPAQETQFFKSLIEKS